MAQTLFGAFLALIFGAVTAIFMVAFQYWLTILGIAHALRHEIWTIELGFENAVKSDIPRMARSYLCEIAQQNRVYNDNISTIAGYDPGFAQKLSVFYLAIHHFVEHGPREIEWSNSHAVFAKQMYGDARSLREELDIFISAERGSKHFPQWLAARLQRIFFVSSRSQKT